MAGADDNTLLQRPCSVLFCFVLFCLDRNSNSFDENGKWENGIKKNPGK